MDAQTLADALDVAAAQLADVAADLAGAGVRLGRVAAQAMWTGRAADAALSALAIDVTALAACAAVADRAARGVRIAADDARAVATALARW